VLYINVLIHLHRIDRIIHDSYFVKIDQPPLRKLIVHILFTSKTSKPRGREHRVKHDLEHHLIVYL
jgi:hypothetical protein